MKKILHLVFITVSFSAWSQEKMDCSGFRKGKFTYRNDSAQLIEVERRGKYQIEKNRVSGEVYRFVIKWTGDCEYQIKQFGANRKKAKKNNGSVTRIKITKVLFNGYEYICPCPANGSVTNFSGTMIKIE